MNKHLFDRLSLTALVCLFLGASLPIHAQTPTPTPTTYTTQTHRYTGNDRYDTAITITQNLYNDHTQTHIILASGEQFPDAIMATNLFTTHNPTPILLTPKTHLTPNTLTELNRLTKSGATITIIGGPDAINDTIDTQLTTQGFTTKRIAGPTRIHTGLQTTTHSPRSTNTLTLTPPNNFALAATAAAYALHHNHPHLYAGTDAETIEQINAFRNKARVSSTTTLGQLPIPLPNSSSEKRILADNPFQLPSTQCYPGVTCMGTGEILSPGPDEQTIAEKLLSTSFGKAEHVIFVAGNSPVDGIAATQLAAKYDAPILPYFPTPDGLITDVSARYDTLLKRLGKASRTIHVVGGPTVIPANWENAMKASLDEGLNSPEQKP